MIIEKVHGLQATAVSLNDRFTILAKLAPDYTGIRRPQQRRRNTLANTITHDFNHGNRLVEKVTRQLEMQAKRALNQRKGFPQQGLRRFGSESNLPRLRRANSFGNLSQQSVKNRVTWRNNGNLSRAASFSNLTNAGWRGFRRRAGGQRMRGRFRGRGGQGRPIGLGRVPRMQLRYRQQGQRGTVRGGSLRGGRGRGRAGIPRNRVSQPVTKEALDLELDQYMAGTKAALDSELDDYMKNAMEIME